MATRDTSRGRFEHNYRLSPSLLRKRVGLRRFPFTTTAEVEPLEEVIEQARAMRAIETGLRIKKRNFNIYVSGVSGTGKSSIIKRLLQEVSAQEPVPPDWCLVNNFRKPDNPIVFPLPAGKGNELKAAMENLIEELKVAVPKAFHGKVHQEKLQRVLNEGIERENRAFQWLARAAQEVGFLVKTTNKGLITIPLSEGKPLGPKDYAALDDQERARIEANRQKLEPLISRFLEETRDIELSVHREVQDAQKALGKQVLKRLFKPVRDGFAEFGPVQRFLDSVEAHILNNLGRFLPDETDRAKVERVMRDRFVEYTVNVLVDNSETRGAPVIFESTPTYFNLVGKIEKRVEHGIYSTDFSMVKAGALIKANGGYVVLHAKDVLTYPFAWDALKSVLRHQKVQIEEMGERFQFLPTSGLRPDPIPVRCKVVLIGSNYIYHLLVSLDEDFAKSFQVKAEFDSMVERNPRTVMEYARFIARTSRRDGLRPVHRSGVAALVEYGSRLSGSQNHMTLRFNTIQNLLIEANAIAAKEGAEAINRAHVEQAWRERWLRKSLVVEKVLEDMTEGTVVIKTEGTEVGAVNGLAVYQFADVAFGKPIRITARTYKGKAGVVNIEREAKLSGNIFNKAVLIVAGFLGDRFAQKTPLSLNVSLAVEQSYGTIEGDSASCAEVCAIISAIASVPLRQDLAVTGSVSQVGAIQAVGGINEKIEGFYRLCKARGLTGTQGVLIPRANTKHLMLDQEVVRDVRRGRFHVYAVDTTEDALRLLTGMEPGERGEDGTYPRGTLYRMVQDRLKEYTGDSDKKSKKRGKQTRKKGGGS